MLGDRDTEKAQALMPSVDAKASPFVTVQGCVGREIESQESQESQEVSHSVFERLEKTSE